MFTYIDDTNAVSETDSVITTLVQASPVSASVTLVNSGVNTLNYHFQALVGQQSGASVWTDLESPGNPTNNSLAAGAVSQPLTISSTWSQVRLMASASGGATLQFNVTRYFNRPDGANIPLLSY